MKSKIVRCLLISSALWAMAAHAVVMRPMGAGFSAPTINDHLNVSDPKIGEIVFDTSDGEFYGYTSDSPATWESLSNSGASGNLATGNCQLTKSSTNLLLSRYNGANLVINGVEETVPLAGVTLSPSGLSANQTYYIYAYMNSGTMTLEASATAYAVDTNGFLTKSGDVTRSLVGMARTNGSTAWVDSNNQRFVRSWFNDSGIACTNAFTTGRSTSSSTNVEVNTEIRCEVLTWANEVIGAGFTATLSNATASNNNATGLGIDGTTMAVEVNDLQVNAGWPHNASGTYSTSALNEGYHYFTLIGRSANSTSITWTSATNVNVRAKK